MNVLLLGSGGRECAISWKVTQSPLLQKLYIAPGNAGTSEFGENCPLDPLDFSAVKELCLEKKIDVLIPGGEDTLVAGIRDFIKNDAALRHIIVVGPDRQAARLEGSKSFAKEFMMRHGIPTAAYKEFGAGDFDQGLAYIKNHSLPVVIKADGLAAGKGVVIAEDTVAAEKAYTEMIRDKVFGEAGSRVVIEEFLEGVEVSFFVLTDGQSYHLLPHAKDYKRISEGDRGLNTGGMGAVSPVPFVDQAFQDKVISRIIEPTIKGLKKDNIDYKGFIFFGLINVNGEPLVIEYNCRLGDPETEVILPRIQSDLLSLMAVLEEPRAFSAANIELSPEACAAVMLVSEGYPGSYARGHEVTGLDRTGQGSLVFHAGTALKDGAVLTNGGRVMAVSSLAATIEAALDISYRNIELISFSGKTYRKDIGHEFIK